MKKFKKRSIILMLFLLLSVVPCKKVFSEDKMDYVAEAVKIEPSEAPTIDGKFNDPVWKKGKMITGFVQRDPFPGAPATENSEVYILYDHENLYVGCRFYDSHPENIISELRRREEIETSDRIELFFDTFHNHRTGYKFSMNPYGVQMDEQRFDDDQRNKDWDAIWQSAAGIDSIGWVAEFKIPFFNMRFPDTEEQIWGFNLQREIRYKAERINWKPVSFDDHTTSIRISKLGHLVGIKGIHPGRTFEFRPYGFTGFSESGTTSRVGKNDAGFDVKYGATSETTVDLTVNPDFAQIEADVLEINLTRYPTRFSEKRDFFLEGSGIFETPLELFYSRRIGARGDILWGTKVTGRAGNGIEYGILGSQTGDWNYFGLSKQNKNLEQALFGTARIKKGFSNGSDIGMMLADMESDNGGDSRVFGLDGHMLFKSVYVAGFQIASSFNPNLTAQNNMYSFNFMRRANPLTFRLNLQRIEPYFDINHTGYMAKESNRGLQKIRPVVIYSPLIEKKGIRQLTVLSSLNVGEDILTNRYISDWQKMNSSVNVKSEYLHGKLSPAFWLFDQAYGIKATNEMEISWWYAVGENNELNKSYYSKIQGVNFSSPRTGKIQRLSANLNSTWGTFYNFSQKYSGYQWLIGCTETSWIKSNVGLELSTEYTKTYDPDKILDGTYFRIGIGNTFLMTKDLFIRVFTQGRWGETFYGKKAINNVYLMSCRIGWEFRPGSWFYLAFNEGRQDVNDLNNPYFQQRDFFMTNRTLGAKIQYAFNK